MSVKILAGGIKRHVNDVLVKQDHFTAVPEKYQQLQSSQPWVEDVFQVLMNCSHSETNWNSTSCAEAINASLLNTTLLNETNILAPELFSDALITGITSVFLGLMILVTVIGNVFVIAAILLERNLQNVANYLIVSLAVADLMVACLVMPLGAVYEISQGWILGPELCDMWTSSDVLCCTASILHLVAIAVDRYWAVTNVDYIHTRNSNRIGIMIFLVWSVALVVSLAPQFGWKDPDYLDRINVHRICMVSQDVAYQIFATFSTFYVPLFIILILYWKIFQTARKRIRRRQEQRSATVIGSPQHQQQQPLQPQPHRSTNNNAAKSFISRRRFLRLGRDVVDTTAVTESLVSSLAMVEAQSTATSVEVLEDGSETMERRRDSSDGEATTAFVISKSGKTPEPTGSQADVSDNVSPEKSSTATTNNGSASHQSHISDMSRAEMLPVQRPGVPVPVNQPTRREKRETLEAKRERKAAKTLAIITGAFVVCWLPFFIMALLMPLCSSCEMNKYVASFFLWLGYFNSTLNPVIYTIFSPEFRQAFKRILCGGHARGRGHNRNLRSGKIR